VKAVQAGQNVQFGSSLHLPEVFLELSFFPEHFVVPVPHFVFMQDVLTGEVFLQVLTICIGKLAVSVRNMAKEKSNIVARAFIRLPKYKK
jgi:hypothetical protein